MLYEKPNNSPCGICGKENNFFDDCGFYYVIVDSKHTDCFNFEVLTTEPYEGKFYVPTCGKHGKISYGDR